MKPVFVAAAGTLVVFGVALVARAYRTGDVPPSRVYESLAPSATEFAPAPSTGQAILPARVDVPEPAPSKAQRLIFLIGSIRGRMESHRTSGTPYTEAELVELMASEREANRLGAELGRILCDDPEGTGPVLALIFAQDDEALAFRLTDAVRGAFRPSTREELAGVLRNSASARERRIAARALAHDPVRLGDLLSASQSDADAGVRTACLRLAASRATSGESSAERSLVRQVASAVANSDSDERVRELAGSIARGLEEVASPSSAVRGIPGTR